MGFPPCRLTPGPPLCSTHPQACPARGRRRWRRRWAATCTSTSARSTTTRCGAAVIEESYSFWELCSCKLLWQRRVSRVPTGDVPHCPDHSAVSSACPARVFAVLRVTGGGARWPADEAVRCCSLLLPALSALLLLFACGNPPAPLCPLVLGCSHSSSLWPLPLEMACRYVDFSLNSAKAARVGAASQGLARVPPGAQGHRRSAARAHTSPCVPSPSGGGVQRMQADAQHNIPYQTGRPSCASSWR